MSDLDLYVTLPLFKLRWNCSMCCCPSGEGMPGEIRGVRKRRRCPMIPESIGNWPTTPAFESRRFWRYPTGLHASTQRFIHWRHQCRILAAVIS
jgi:hypothetical protein